MNTHLYSADARMEVLASNDPGRSIVEAEILNASNIDEVTDILKISDTSEDHERDPDRSSFI